MAHDYNVASTSIEKPAEHPAKAIMAKRWEERRAEARARRVAELRAGLRLGDSGLITLKEVAETAAISSRPPLAAATDLTAERSSPTFTETESTPALADLAAELPSAAVSGSPMLADLPAPESGLPISALAPVAAAQTAPSWLRDSRKAMLVVALVSNVLLLALLYFGGFIG